MGIDTWGVDYVLLDENDEVIGDAYAYRDGRTKNTIPSVHKRVPFAELYKKTGIQFAQYNTVYQLYDDVRTGKIERAASISQSARLFSLPFDGREKAGIHDGYHFRDGKRGNARLRYGNFRKTRL